MWAAQHVLGCNWACVGASVLCWHWRTGFRSPGAALITLNIIVNHHTPRNTTLAPMPGGRCLWAPIPGPWSCGGGVRLRLC